MEYVDVYRFAKDGHHLGDADWPPKPVTNTAAAFVAEGDRYAYEQILLLAVLATTRRIPLDPVSKRVLRFVLDHAAGLLLKLTSGGKEPMICSELVDRCFKEAVQPGKYALRIAGVDYAALRAAAARALRPDADDDTRELERARRAFLTAYLAAREQGARAAIRGEGPAAQVLEVPDFVTPHDLEASRDLEKVGRLDLAEASGIKKGGRNMAVVIRSRETIPEALVRAKRAAAEQFLSHPTAASASAYAISTKPQHNVVGVGIGRKITQGKATTRHCIRIYVERKVAKGLIPKEFMLPAKLEGVETDVIEVGRFRALPAAVPLPQKRARPARPGCSVGFQFTGNKAGYVMAGTFGAVVTTDGVLYILSNNHVLANENALPNGSAIFQPGLLDHGNPSKDQIAKLTRFIPVQAGGPNAVDCAIAEILKQNTASASFLPKVGVLKSPAPIDAAEGMHVHKVGRTTGYTTGTVFDVSADVSVSYDLGAVTFQDQVLIRGDGGGMFSAAGDSGSVIVDRATQRATALLFAGSNTHTIANHLSDVLAQLQVTMVI